MLKSAFFSFASLAALNAVSGQTPADVTVSAPTQTPTKAVGKLPALGWNSWNAYGCDIDESKFLDAANQFISLGLKDAGYEYVNIDDCWSNKDGRNPTTNRIVPNATRFPNGIDGLATEVHNLGLKFGIYSDAGTQTCAGYPASLGNEAIDAATFDEWGIDYLKYDNCNVPANWTDAPTPPDNDWYNSNSSIRYRQMTAALDSVSRPIEFSLCIWGDANVWEWGAKVGHSWRISGDATPEWSFITSVIAQNVGISEYINFYAHNDMDMMEIGNGALTIEEQRSHFAAWAFLKSPILLGTDLSKLNSTQLAIIKNAELLAFHQDPKVGTPAKPFTAFSSMPSTSPPEYYAGTSTKGTHVFILNTSNVTETKKFKFSNVPGLGTSGHFRLHNMWTGADLAGTHSASSTFSVSVAPHDTVAYHISKA
ncbi:glycoside hydrolase [Gymnopilus junonius]|uniref:Alpha-galactosidase n=1 Tax=Gymnopilus junonius TaxID=109634 RepID=A0A9P5NQS3_GYMJU|nr:glycoside hydrolase [Gymnopilus junonius]